MNKPLNILAISGSLKSSSSNSAILRAISRFAVENTDFVFCDDLDKLPHFNPEKEEGTNAVKTFKAKLQNADGIIISTPEYAFGVPGALKNALDWTVSSGDFNEKPVVAISASPMYEGGAKAMTSLLLTLGALGARMTDQSHLCIPDILNKINRQAEIRDEEMKNNLIELFDLLILEIKKKVKTTNP